MWKFPKHVSLLPMWLWEVGRLSLEIGTVNVLDGAKCLGTESIAGCALSGVCCSLFFCSACFFSCPHSLPN